MEKSWRVGDGGMEREVIEQKEKKKKAKMNRPRSRNISQVREGMGGEGGVERKGIGVKEERAPEKLKNNGEKENERILSHLLILHTW